MKTIVAAERRAKVLDMVMAGPDLGIPLAEIVDRLNNEYSKSDISNTLTHLKAQGLVFRRKRANHDKKATWSKLSENPRAGSSMNNMILKWYVDVDKLTRRKRKKGPKPRRPRSTALVHVVGL